MSNQEISDKQLRCAACGDGFVFSAGEQELFRLRGIAAQPEHCPSCSRGQRAGEHRTQLYSPPR